MVPDLTDAHYALLKTDITITNFNEFEAALAATDDAALAAAYNLPALPDYWAWRTAVPRGEFLFTTSSEGTTFTFVGNGFIGRSAGEFEAWRQLFRLDTDETNPALPQVRQAFQDIFSGIGTAAANRQHLAIVARRLVTRAERLFATGAGSLAAPGVLGPEGALTYLDIAKAFGRE
jgi:hypothetical protein